MADVPSGGVPWSIFTPIQRSNIEYWSGVNGINPQVLMNMLWRESGIGDIAAGTGRLNPNATGAPGVKGIAQINMNNTGPGLGVTNPMDDGQAIMGLATAVRIYGTGGTIGNNPSTTREGTLPFDLNRGVVFYNAGPGKTDPRTGQPISGGRLWEMRGRDNTALSEETRGYQEHVLRGSGVAPPSVGTQGERSLGWTDPQAEQNWRLNDEALGFLGPGGQVRTNEAWGANPVGDFWRMQGGPSAMLGQELPWNLPGIISPEVGHYFQTLGLMPSNLQPTGGTDFTNTTWTGVPGSQPGWWGPWGAENVHNWAQEGISHGYGDPIMSMLGNLNYNLVDPGLPPGSPPLGGQPAPIGPRTGLDPAPTGVGLANWIAQQWGSPWGSANAMDRPRSNVYDASNMFPQDMRLPWDPGSPRASEWAGHPDLTFWDATRPSNVHVIDQPSGPSGDANPIKVWGGDVTNWVPAPSSSTWGTPGQISPYTGWQVGQGMFYNPNTQNWGTPAPGAPGGIGSWSPSGGYSGPGGFTAPGPGGPEDTPIDYQHYFDTMNIGAAPRDVYQTPGPFGTSAVQDYGQPSVTEQIDTTSAQNAAFNAQQVANFNAGINNGSIWTTGSTTFNPVTGQSVNPWNPMAGINSLTGQSNWG